MSAAFTVNPDFEIIKKYYFKDADEDAFYDLIADFKDSGCQYASHMADTKEERIEFEEKFKEIIQGFNLSDYYNNLLYICLFLYERNWDTIGNIFVNLPYLEKGKEYLKPKDYPDDLKDQIRANQLAKLILNIRSQSYPNKISFQYEKLDSNLLRDEILCKWICDLIVDSVEKGKFPAMLGSYISSFIWDSEKGKLGSDLNLDMIKEEAEHNPVQVLGLRNDAICRFCLLLHEYVNGEKLLKGKEAVKFSTKQLTFYLDIALLFNMFPQEKAEKIIREPKGYHPDDIAVFSKLLRDCLKKHLK